MSHCRIHSVSAAPTAVWCSAESEPDLNLYLPKHPSTTCWVRIQNVPSTLFPEEAAMTDVHAKAPRSLETGADSSAVLLRGLVAHLRQQRSEEHTSELQSRVDLVCRLLLEKKNA